MSTPYAEPTPNTGSLFDSQLGGQVFDKPLPMLTRPIIVSKAEITASLIPAEGVGTAIATRFQCSSAQLYLVLERRGYQKRKEDWNRGYTWTGKTNGRPIRKWHQNKSFLFQSHQDDTIVLCRSQVGLLESIRETVHLWGEEYLSDTFVTTIHYCADPRPGFSEHLRQAAWRDRLGVQAQLHSPLPLLAPYLMSRFMTLLIRIMCYPRKNSRHTETGRYQNPRDKARAVAVGLHALYFQ